MSWLVQEATIVKEEIDRLRVKCPQYVIGCDWKGQFKDYLVSDQ